MVTNRRDDCGRFSFFSIVNYGNWLIKYLYNSSITLAKMTFCGVFLFSLLIISIFCPTYCQQCPSGQSKIIQLSELNKYDLGTCERVNDYSGYVMSFLGGCTFTSSDTASGRGACHYECLYDARCHALTYTAAGGCKICRPTSETGNGNDAPRCDVFVAGSKLRDYING